MELLSMSKIRIVSTSFTNLEKAFSNLQRSLGTPITEPRDLSGIIKDFEMVYELSWKVLKKYLESEGLQTAGPKDVFTKAFHAGYIDDEAMWLAMINDRNQAAHVYDELEAQKIVNRVRTDYFSMVAKTFDLT